MTHRQLEPSSPNLVHPLPTPNLQHALHFCPWNGHWLLPIMPIKTRDPSLSLTPKSNASPSPTKVTFYIFLKSMYLSPPRHRLPEPSPPPHSWPGLFLINFLSSPLPSLQSFLHTNLVWHFQNAHTTNALPHSYNSDLKTSVAVIAFRIKIKTRPHRP